MTRTTNFITRRIVPFAFAALLAFAARPVKADTLLYTNGAVNGTIDSDGISSAGVTVSDSFTISANSTLTAATIGLWMKPGDTPSAVDWAIGTTPAGTDIASGTSTFFNQTNLFLNSDGYDIWQSSLYIGGSVAPGAYWFSLGGATSSLGEGVNWDLTDGPSLADILEGSTLNTGDYSESFQIYGATSGTIPEPSSLGLLGMGVISLGILRRSTYRIGKEKIRA
jgi:hypothetical protein